MSVSFFEKYNISCNETLDILQSYYDLVLEPNKKSGCAMYNLHNREMEFFENGCIVCGRYMYGNSCYVLFDEGDYDDGIIYLRHNYGMYWQPKHYGTDGFKNQVYDTLFPNMRRTVDNDKEVIRTIKNHLEFVNNHKECYKVENKTFRDELTGMLNLVSSATNKQILVALKKDATERGKMLQDLNEAMKPEFFPADSLPDAIANADAYIHYLLVNLEAANARVDELTETMNKINNIIYDATEKRIREPEVLND